MPVYAHPTLTVLVDDSDSFLRSLSFQLDPRLASRTFHDTSKALQWLHQSRRPGQLPLQANYDSPYQPGELCSVALDLDSIHRISLQPQRFAIPSVVVVDYSMPQMNGLEFCEQLRGLPCKKILFTGAADEKIAVNAFNRGLIDRYVKKSDERALDTLEEEIIALQQAYFAEQSETLCRMAALHSYSFLEDAALCAQVELLRRKHGFVEHYLYASPNGVLFFDKRGKARLMMIETESGMCAQYEIARDSEAPASLLNALQERRVLPFFSDGDGMYSPSVGDNWHRYCTPAHVCEGHERYYWALFDMPPHYLDGPLYSYSRFLLDERAPGGVAA